MGPLLELVQVPLDGILSLRHVNCTTQLGVVCSLAEGALNPTVYVIDEDIALAGGEKKTARWWLAIGASKCVQVTPGALVLQCISLAL